MSPQVVLEAMVNANTSPAAPREQHMGLTPPQQGLMASSPQQMPGGAKAHGGRRSDVGCFVGIGSSDYEALCERNGVQVGGRSAGGTGVRAPFISWGFSN